jgi:hypothetical protein
MDCTLLQDEIESQTTPQRKRVFGLIAWADTARFYGSRRRTKNVGSAQTPTGEAVGGHYSPLPWGPKMETTA